MTHKTEVALLWGMILASAVGAIAVVLVCAGTLIGELFTIV